VGPERSAGRSPAGLPVTRLALVANRSMITLGCFGLIMSRVAETTRPTRRWNCSDAIRSRICVTRRSKHKTDNLEPHTVADSRVRPLLPRPAAGVLPEQNPLCATARGQMLRRASASQKGRGLTVSPGPATDARQVSPWARRTAPRRPWLAGSSRYCSGRAPPGGSQRGPGCARTTRRRQRVVGTSFGALEEIASSVSAPGLTAPGPPDGWTDPVGEARPDVGHGAALTDGTCVSFLCLVAAAAALNARTKS
jgi:hypothetical protein